MVEGFARSSPNAVLIAFAARERHRAGVRRALDIGCGAGRNALPLADQGWQVVGTDLSWPMLVAAAARARASESAGRVHTVLAPMDHLPIRDGSMDLIVAHGIWNLARSGAQFRQAVREAARVAAPGAALFVFTFSRNTFPPETAPIAGEAFVFTEFSGEPQCFLTEPQLDEELARGGFSRDPSVPFTEYNRRQPGQIQTGSAPAIFEATYRRLR